MSIEAFEPFPCGECGTPVGMNPATGETWMFTRGISREIPRGTPLPKCPKCGTTYHYCERWGLT